MVVGESMLGTTGLESTTGEVRGGGSGGGGGDFFAFP